MKFKTCGGCKWFPVDAGELEFIQCPKTAAMVVRWQDRNFAECYEERDGS